MKLRVSPSKYIKIRGGRSALQAVFYKLGILSTTILIEHLTKQRNRHTMSSRTQAPSIQTVDYGAKFVR